MKTIKSIYYLISVVLLMQGLQSCKSREEKTAEVENLIKNEQFQEAFTMLKELENESDTLVLNRLAFLYKEGKGTEKNENKYYDYAKKSADLGNAYAQYLVGNCFADGVGVEKDLKNAFAYHKKSAEQNYAPGLYEVGRDYIYSRGTENDDAKGFECTQKSADMGYPKAVFQLGKLYRFGYGVLQDADKALAYFVKSGEMGVALGYRNAAMMYDDGIGIDSDYRVARKYYELAADMEDPYCMSFMGDFCQNDKEYKKAIEWYENAIKKNSVIAMYSLGKMYFNGIGVDKDEQKGKKLVNQAVSYTRQHVEELEGFELYTIGLLFKKGDKAFGISEDYATYTKYINRGKDMGSRNARLEYEFEWGEDY